MVDITLSDETEHGRTGYTHSGDAYARRASEDLQQATAQAALLSEAAARHGTDIAEKARTTWSALAAEWAGIAAGFAAPGAAQSFAAYWKDAAQHHPHQ